MSADRSGSEKIVISTWWLVGGSAAAVFGVFLMMTGIVSTGAVLGSAFWIILLGAIILTVVSRSRRKQELVEAGAIAFGPASHHSLVLFADRIRTPDGEFPLDPSVCASVETSGSLQERQRITATRMVALGIFALATPKRTTTDNRKLYILVEGTTFQSVVPVNPNRETAARKFAAQVTTQARRAKTQPVTAAGLVWSPSDT